MIKKIVTPSGIYYRASANWQLWRKVLLIKLLKYYLKLWKHCKFLKEHKTKIQEMAPKTTQLKFKI